MEPRSFGDYKVVKQIGQGPLGSVYLAEHQFLKRQYALKVLPEELASDRSFVQRLEDEVGLLATLEHPHIVKIHNISCSQGSYFLVTDCIVDELGETTNLGQYLTARGRTLSEDEIVRLLRQIADALTYAHNKKISGKGIAHRGIKLNNILIGNSNGAPHAFLSDYGLSRIVGTNLILTRTYQAVAESLGMAHVFAANKSLRYPNNNPDTNKLIALQQSFLQNYAFLAPEQKKGDTQNIDSKADVYAFGVLSYLLLVGETPEGIFDMPSARFPQYTMKWDTLISNCLQTDPNRRPESLLQVLECISNPAMKETPPQTETSIPQPKIRTPQLERPIVDPDPASAFRIDSSVKHYVPENNEDRNIQPLLTEMVVIRGGTYYRGSDDGNRDEQPHHQIKLSSFAIDIHPVTNEQFVRFLEAMGGEKDNNHNDIIRLRDARIKRTAGKLSIESGYAKHPVVGVTWYGAVAYAKWVGKRLPTEAEWEIAAYGGLENALYPTGEELEKSQANFFSSDTTAVMSYPPNNCGCYDMAGNVYEWCYDWYGYNYYEQSVQEPENPHGPLQGVYRVLRGGCWKSLKEDLRCSRRNRNNPGTVNSTYGFRCAADVE